MELPYDIGGEAKRLLTTGRSVPFAAIEWLSDQ